MKPFRSFRSPGFVAGIGCIAVGGIGYFFHVDLIAILAKIVVYWPSVFIYFGVFFVLNFFNERSVDSN